MINYAPNADIASTEVQYHAWGHNDSSNATLQCTIPVPTTVSINSVASFALGHVASFALGHLAKRYVTMAQAGHD